MPRLVGDTDKLPRFTDAEFADEGMRRYGSSWPEMLRTYPAIHAGRRGLASGYRLGRLVTGWLEGFRLAWFCRKRKDA